MACSWLPQTCITLTGARPRPSVTRPSASVSARARAGSRNSSRPTPSAIAALARSSGHRRARGDLPAHVGGHQVVGLGEADELVVEGEGLADLLGGDATDGVP